jgi:guanosine-3',5'-bis(diphosphate) 3'-pyrophosphohydrolase
MQILFRKNKIWIRMIKMSEKCVITIEDVLYQAKRKNRNIDIYKIKKAYLYAENKHKNQYRKSGEPYIIHPLHVAYTLAKLGLDTQTICAALLHDVVEDTDACYGDIEKNFGTEIAQIVEGVTKITELFKSVEEKQAENYNKMFGAMEKDIRIIILKLADRLHNINTLEHLKRDRQIAISKETIELYAPIAYKLGMYELKTQLEDGAFKYLYPDDYKNIIIELEEKKKQKQELLDKTKEKIKQELKRQRITAIVKIETKHLYKKMNEKKIGMDEIKDLFAIKIITKQKQECYMILGIINTLYNLIPGTFKDYIATPRNNMYEAIHEIILGEKGVELEVQICSYTMNKIAKYGIINYLPYIKKEEMNFKKNLSGIHYSLELKKILEDPKEFLTTLKSELLEDEIYIFTPKGDIKVLPKGATAIDFAYSIHDEVGNHMVGCKINSIEMPLVTKLKNGNIVEIITSELKTVPEEEWIEVIKTAKAKNQILKLLQTKKEEEKKSIKIEILAFDRKNLALEITNVFMKNGINIKELQTEVTNNKAKINIVAEIRRMEQVDKLSEELMEIPNMIRVIK